METPAEDFAVIPSVFVRLLPVAGADGVTGRQQTGPHHSVGEETLFLCNQNQKLLFAALWHEFAPVSLSLPGEVNLLLGENVGFMTEVMNEYPKGCW